LLEALDADGVATVKGLLSPSQCTSLASLYDDAQRFRSKVVMDRHGYGSGEYQYFGYPLPPLVAALREAVYPKLVPLANRWHEALGSDAGFPAEHAEFVERCHAAGQLRPTPLLLRYEAGDYNRLHQDLYGEHVFPLQLAVLLSVPGKDFEGGELVLTEQRARMQSRALVFTPQQGDAVLFAVRDRPVPSKRGYARAQMRHGVSTIKRGHRQTLGIIFHDAT
jgi:hypothetical protein